MTDRTNQPSKKGARPSRWLHSPALGRALVIAVGIAYGVAAAITASHAFGGIAELRSRRWPVFAAQAAILAVVSFLALAGAIIHPAALSVTAVGMIVLMLAHSESESEIAPIVALGAVGVGYVYVRWGRGSIRMLPAARIVALVLSLLFVFAALSRAEEQPATLRWVRVRTAAGGAELQTFYLQGSCREIPAAPKDASEIASGCIEVVPARRAWYVIGFSAAAAVLATVAIAGAARIRRLSDGTPVPAWT